MRDAGRLDASGVTQRPSLWRVEEEPAAEREDLTRVRKSQSQEAEIDRLREEATEASDEYARLAAETLEAHRHEAELDTLVGRLRTDAQVQEHQLATLRDRLATVDVELDDLRAVRDALTPPDLPSRPGLDLAASFRPAEQVGGDFYLVAEGPRDVTVLVVGDVIGKGLTAARRAAFVRTVFATTVPFSDDPAQLLGWANVALMERAADNEGDFVTVACAAFAPRERVVRWGYAGHPGMLWLDTGEELEGGRAIPLGLDADVAFTAASGDSTPSTGVLLYTDGLTEARHNGEQFGPTRLTNTVQVLKGQSPSRIVAALTEEVEQFSEHGLPDDLCVLAARIN